MERKPSILANPKVAVSLVIALMVGGIAAFVGNAVQAPAKGATPPSSGTSFPAYRVTLRAPLMTWSSQGAIQAMQKFVAAHPSARTLPPGLGSQIRCVLPAGAHAWVQPFDSWRKPGTPSRFADVSDPALDCEGVARLPP